MEESVDLREEAGKENKQRLAHLSKLRNFCRSRNQNNAQYKTKSDLNAWKKFYESLKESRTIENIPANDLDFLLSKFFISVLKQNGTQYEPLRSLSGFQRCFQRYFLVWPYNKHLINRASR